MTFQNILTLHSVLSQHPQLTTVLKSTLRSKIQLQNVPTLSTTTINRHHVKALIRYNRSPTIKHLNRHQGAMTFNARILTNNNRTRNLTVNAIYKSNNQVKTLTFLRNSNVTNKSSIILRRLDTPSIENNLPRNAQNRTTNHRVVHDSNITNHKTEMKDTSHGILVATIQHSYNRRAARVQLNKRYNRYQAHIININRAMNRHIASVCLITRNINAHRHSNRRIDVVTNHAHNKCPYKRCRRRNDNHRRHTGATRRQ